MILLHHVWASYPLLDSSLSGSWGDCVCTWRVVARGAQPRPDRRGDSELRLYRQL